ncbi:hypothetical protein BDR03DRAFT_972485 [Suillus americanus]|nr:hypothetical protein BDR03DRAFT_972485 [Suillus americanus]
MLPSSMHVLKLCYQISNKLHLRESRIPNLPPPFCRRPGTTSFANNNSVPATLTTTIGACPYSTFQEGDSPDTHNIFPDQNSKVFFMDKLQASFDEQKESATDSTPVISATAGTSSSNNYIPNLGGITKKKLAAADSNSFIRTNAHSTTAR